MFGTPSDEQQGLSTPDVRGHGPLPLQYTREREEHRPTRAVVLSLEHLALRPPDGHAQGIDLPVYRRYGQQRG